MSYYERIRELTKSVPVSLVDFGIPCDPARTPMQASSNFITNKEQGDWAENLITRAINETSKNHVAIKYGKSDDLVAGEDGFDSFYRDFQTELDTIGKRPDLLIFKKSDFNEYLGYDISQIPHYQITDYAKRAVAGVEVRSSAFLIDRYEEVMQIRTEKFKQIAIQTKDKILAEFKDVLDHPTRSLSDLLFINKIKKIRDSLFFGYGLISSYLSRCVITAICISAVPLCPGIQKGAFGSRLSY